MSAPAGPASQKIVVRLRSALRRRHYSPRTEEAYVGWLRRFVRFHNLRHPAELGEDAIVAFATWLAGECRVSAATQTQATSALLFFYREVLEQDVGRLEGILRARQPQRAPAPRGVAAPGQGRGFRRGGAGGASGQGREGPGNDAAAGP
jgi:integrase-like protein